MTIVEWVVPPLLVVVLTVLAQQVWQCRSLAVVLDRALSGMLAFTLGTAAAAVLGLGMILSPVFPWPGPRADAAAVMGTLLALSAAAATLPYFRRAVRAAHAMSKQIPHSIYADAIRHAPVALIVLDDQGRVLYAEGGALNSAGWLQAAAIGQLASVALPPNAARAVTEVWRGAMEGRTTKHRVYTASDREGAAMWYALTGAPTRVNGTRAVVLAVELDGVAEATARVQAHLESIKSAFED